MKIKLDENLGKGAAHLLTGAGHDVATVADQALCGAADRDLIGACQREGRSLVTLDVDFANPLVFKPSEYAGIAVLRLPPTPEPADLKQAIAMLAGALSRRSIEGRLWIVQRDRIREYQPD